MLVVSLNMVSKFLLQMSPGIPDTGRGPLAGGQERGKHLFIILSTEPSCNRHYFMTRSNHGSFKSQL